MTDCNVERLTLHWIGRQKVADMESHHTVEELKSVCVTELLPLFIQAYADKTAAWAKWWYAPKGSKVPKGGTSYDSLHDFIVEAIRRQNDKFGGGPFLSHDAMLQAMKELAQNNNVLRFAPNGIRADHVNPEWFTAAAEQFIQQQRFLDKTPTLQDVMPYYISNKGLYFVRQPKREQRHH